MRAEKQGS